MLFRRLQVSSHRVKYLLRSALGGVYAILSLCASHQPGHSQSIYLSPHILHTPALQAPAAAEIEIGLILEEGADEIASAILLWRSPGGEFRTADLEPVPGGLAQVIPATDVNPPHLEYAIVVRFVNGQEVTFPQHDPFLAPQVINVIQKVPPKTPGPEFVVLYPRAGDAVYDKEVHVAVSIFDPDSVFDPSSLEAFIDGQKVKPQKASATFLLLSANDLKPGQHRVVLRSKNFDGQDNPEYSWSFSTAGKGQKHPPGTFAWSFTGEARWEEFGDEDEEGEGVLRGDWRAVGEIGRWEYAARCYLTSEEAWNRQPQDRFLFTLRSRRLSLELGDATPMFSDLVLSGKRVRGVELGFHTNEYNASINSHLLGVFGEVNKPIAGSTYRRYLAGFRPYFTTSSGARFGLSFLKVKDDLGSISDDDPSPKDNVVTGLDVLLPFFQQKLQLSFSAALSLTAMDIRGGALSQGALDSADIDVPFDPQPLEPIIVINESMTPPNPLGLGSLAWTTALNVNHFGQILSLSYRSIGPAYYSLGNPYLQNDLAGWNISDQVPFWKNRAFVNLGFTYLEDNLRNTKTATTTTTGGWASLALYPGAWAPQMVMTANVSRGFNDLQNIDIFEPTDTTTTYSDLRRDDWSKTFSGSLSQGIYVLQRRHFMTLSANLTDYEDGYSDRPPGYPQLGSSSRNYGAIWRTQFSTNQNASLEYSYYSSSTADTADLPYQYHQFGGAALGRFLNRKLSISLGGYRRIGNNDLSRWQGDLVAEWEFYAKHLLRASGTHYFNDSVWDEGIYRLYYFKRF